MAVQIANSLSTRIDCSALCSSRKGGRLSKEIYEDVKFIQLNKKLTLDLFALIKLRKFVKKNNINIIHAHGSSFFMASVLRVITPKLKLVWHDHFGLKREGKTSINDYILMFCSIYFNQIIVVKKDLRDWALQHLKCRNVELINNYSNVSVLSKKLNSNTLKGDSNSIKIIHIANFRPQKDHLTGLKAIRLLKDKNFNITYHLFGNYIKEEHYYKSIMAYINSNHLDNEVFIYGAKQNISDYLRISDIGILTSISEGMPLSVIEYALANLPIVVSNAGECKSFVGDYAKVFEPRDYLTLFEHLKDVISNKNLTTQNAEKLYNQAIKLYSEESVLKKLLLVYERL